MFLLVVLLVVAQGTQFITGPCTRDADCASGCCGFNSGKCAGAIIAQERDGGCGFGDAQPNDNAAQLLRGLSSAAPSPSAAGKPTAATGQPTTLRTVAGQASPTSSGAGNGAGKQFITGPCTSDADCASGCCGFNTGKCAGAIIAQERDGGCGFVNGQSSHNAARTLQGLQ